MIIAVVATGGDGVDAGADNSVLTGDVPGPVTGLQVMAVHQTSYNRNNLDEIFLMK